MDEDFSNLLIYSNERLKNIFNDVSNKDEAITTHIKSAKYKKIDEFNEGLEWFNTSEALTFKEHLNGKIVLLDFFTYCCINCMHILPDLEALENEFSIEDGLVIIGVHSAKFENEKQSNNILSAVQRYDIKHPVVNDADSLLWNNCEIFSWPTLLLIGPFGNPLIMYVGEGNREDLTIYIRNALHYYKSMDAISKHSLPIKFTYHLLSDNKEPLLFPGKITTYLDENNSEILAISDTGNHRILLCKNDGSIFKQVGNGKRGFKDGRLEDAEFHSPQGLVFHNKDILFVADTENHVIRKINLKSNIVETIIGTGKQGFDKVGGNTGKEQIISSPWDLSLYKLSHSSAEILLIAMAGTHQIWAYFFQDTTWWKNQKYTSTTCVCIAGSGNEENRNNSYPLKASFAQPSGLAIANKNQELYIADSESSSIRRISLVTGKVTSVVGGDRDPCNLFAYGDKDGNCYDAKLQHVLGLAIDKDEDALLVADTYNHKLKTVDIVKNVITSLVDDDVNTLVKFNEPGGLTASKIEKKLYVADTNNHCIRIVTIANDMKRICKIEKLNLQFDHEDVDYSKGKDRIDIYKSKAIDVNCNGCKVFVKINLHFLNGTSLNNDAPQKWHYISPNSTWNCKPTEGKDVSEFTTVLTIPSITKEHILDFNVLFYMCSLNACVPKKFLIRLQINPSGNKSTKDFSFNVKLDINEESIMLH